MCHRSNILEHWNSKKFISSFTLLYDDYTYLESIKIIHYNIVLICQNLKTLLPLYIYIIAKHMVHCLSLSLTSTSCYVGYCIASRTKYLQELSISSPNHATDLLNSRVLMLYSTMVDINITLIIHMSKQTLSNLCSQLSRNNFAIEIYLYLYRWI